MIIVADSGSTKCDWVIVDEQGEKTYTSTIGFNPFFHDSTTVKNAILRDNLIRSKKSEITGVYFYGAGCSSPARNAIIEKALKAVFEEADTIVVDHDLTGAAIATAGRESGIVCILGTGSNSCYYDGRKTFQSAPALGYVLGDEGSGAYFGKKFIVDWVYQRMPEPLYSSFQKAFGLEKEEILSSVYNQPNANVYLASFMPFVSENRNNPYTRAVLIKGLSEFADYHITCFEQASSEPVHFVGSIAYYFGEELNEVAKEFGFTVGNVVKKPVTPLADFHFEESQLV